jgi:hypothetical protein
MSGVGGFAAVLCLGEWSGSIKEEKSSFMCGNDCVDIVFFFFLLLLVSL